MKIYYIANFRMPTEKAHGIQIAKMCEAFIEEGVDLTLVVPNRRNNKKSLKDYYNLRVEVNAKYLPVIDLYIYGRLGYLISTFTFSLSYIFFLLKKKICGEKFIIYTVDADNYSLSSIGLILLNVPIFSEMHTSKLRSIPQSILFKKIYGIIAINKIIVEELKSNFPKSKVKYIVESNGVDLSDFGEKFNKEESREKLGIPQNIPIVLYSGRFFEWKGLEILAKSAKETPSIRWQSVGGAKEDFSRLVKEPLSDNIFFAGNRPFSEMPLWISASDILIVLGTKRDIQSYRYTSPMKLFEYLAGGRIIVASKTPAILEIVNDKEVLFYEPDNSEDLVRVINLALEQKDKLKSLIEESKKHAVKVSWGARAGRIIEFIFKP